MCVCLCICVHVSMGCVCVCVCCVCTHTCLYVRKKEQRGGVCGCECIRGYIRMHVSQRVCVYVWQSLCAFEAVFVCLQNLLCGKNILSPLRKNGGARRYLCNARRRLNKRTRGHLRYRLLVSHINKRTPAVQTAGLSHQQEDTWGKDCWSLTSTSGHLGWKLLAFYQLEASLRLPISQGFAVKANPTHHFGTN